MNSLYTFSFENGDLEKIKTHNCENFMGSVEVPVGVAGPAKVNFNLQQNGKNVAISENWHFPLATTEGALVASVSRGCKVMRLAGGVSVSVKKVGMSRAPLFEAPDLHRAENFVAWLEANNSEIKKTCENTSSHLKLKNFQSWLRGRKIFVRFVFDTDQAMGMNMVTFALDELWKNFLSKNSEIKKLGIKMISLSSNFCTDKKDSQINRIFGRGYHVRTEIKIPEKIIQEVLHVSSVEIVCTHIGKNLIGTNLSGSFSQNMQVANVAGAMFLATGQDIAHVVEASQASVSFEQESDGLYVSLDLPNLNVGVVGGGTWLPAQKQARLLIRDGREISAEQLAMAIGVASLAGEISGLAALTHQSLASAHKKLARGGGVSGDNK